MYHASAGSARSDYAAVMAVVLFRDLLIFEALPHVVAPQEHEAKPVLTEEPEEPIRQVVRIPRLDCVAKAGRRSDEELVQLAVSRTSTSKCPPSDGAQAGVGGLGRVAASTSS